MDLIGFFLLLFPRAGSIFEVAWFSRSSYPRFQSSGAPPLPFLMKSLLCSGPDSPVVKKVYFFGDLPLAEARKISAWEGPLTGLLLMSVHHSFSFCMGPASFACPRPYT